MNITWLGHDAFLFETEKAKIISDPYVAGSYDGAVGYKQIDEHVDIAMISHDHPDHGGYQDLPGNPEVVKDPGSVTVKGIPFKGIATFHDKTKGAERGSNTVFIFEVEELRVCHLGDLGHLLDEKTVAEIGEVDILFVPVGGFYTIDHQEAWQVVMALAPGIVFPMHYKTDVLDFPLDQVDTFLEGKSNISKIDGYQIKLNKNDSSGDKRIIVFTKHKL